MILKDLNDIPGHKDWFGASLLARGGKLIACAPKSINRKIEWKERFNGRRHYTGYADMLQNTGLLSSLLNYVLFYVDIIQGNKISLLIY